MAWALVASEVGGGTNSSVTTAAIDTTGATLIVVSLSRDVNTNATNFSDSKGNTWRLLNYYDQGAVRNMMYYCVPTSVGSGHTFSNSGSFNYSTLAVAAFSGNAPFLIEDRLSASGNSATTVLPGSITPSQDNTLVVTTCAFSGTGSTPLSINGGFTKNEEIDFSSGNYYGNGIAHLIQTTAAAANPTWTKTGATPFVSIQASFKLSPEVSTAWLRV